MTLLPFPAYVIIGHFLQNPPFPLTALLFNAEAFTNNRTIQAVEQEKLTRKFTQKKSAIFGAGEYIYFF